jgi:transposase
MATTEVLCRFCQGPTYRNGVGSAGHQRFRCRTCGKSFQLEYHNQAWQPGVKELILPMTVNGGGVRDIARVLHIDKNTVMSQIKKGRPGFPQ